jgi:hypothetical protein
VSLLTQAALRRLRGVSAVRGLAWVAWTWAWIAASFALFIAYPGVATWLIAAVVVSGRQMGSRC